MEVKSSAAASRYEIRPVLRFVTQVEAAYGVSIKFWLDFRSDPAGNLDLFVFAWGSGSVFDILPESVGPRPVKIDQAELNAIGEGLYYACSHLERLLSGVKEPIGPRPSL